MNLPKVTLAIEQPTSDDRRVGRTTKPQKNIANDSASFRRDALNLEHPEAKKKKAFRRRTPNQE